MASSDLVLTLGASSTAAPIKTVPSAPIFELTLGLSGGFSEPTMKKKTCDESEEMYVQASSVSSFSNGASMKRELDAEEEEEDDGSNNPRKKLRLTKEQSALLEESFKHHITLNPKEKQALARELNLRPRQVEVWFQNRRARTKLKQTEMDCEFLKKWCETLTEENRKLQREVHELKAVKHQQQPQQPQPLYMQLPAATLTMCPSCERIGAAENKATQNPIFFNPFAKPSSAAC